MAKFKIPIAAAASVAIVVCGMRLTGATPQSFFFWHSNPGFPAWLVSGSVPSVKGMPPELRSHAEKITIVNPGFLDFVQIPLQTVNDGRLNISIAADANGVPGKVLEEFPHVVAPHIGDPNSLAVYSIAHPELRLGVSYWLCAEPADSSTIAAWFYDTNLPQRGFAMKQGNSEWTWMKAGTMVQNTVAHYPNAIYRGQIYSPLVVVKPGK